VRSARPDGGPAPRRFRRLPPGYFWTDDRGGSRCDPANDPGRRLHFVAGRQDRAVDHQHGQAEVAGRLKLRDRTSAAGILADDQVDSVALHQQAIRFGAERATVDDHRMVGQRWGFCWGIDKAQHVVMLGLGGKLCEMHAANGQHDAAWRPGQSGDGGIHIWYRLPSVALARLPRRARQSEKRNPGFAGCHHRIGAHLRGERVCGIHDMGDLMVAQVGYKPRHAAKPTDTDRDRLCFWVIDAAHVGQGRGNSGLCEGAGQGAGFGRAAKNEDVGHD